MSAPSDHALGDPRFGCKHSNNNENPRCQGFHRSLPYDRPLAAAEKLQSSVPMRQDGSFAKKGITSAQLAALGGLAFCKRLPAECAVDSREIEIIHLTPSVWRVLSETTERVNASIRPVSDRDHWGVADRWDYPDDGAGDCEDIQLLKRKLLSAAGLPRRALRMTVVYDEHQTGHAVLMVRTDRGDLILDNRTNAVLPWWQTGYDFVKREGDGPDWVQLSPRAAPTATAESAR